MPRSVLAVPLGGYVRGVSDLVSQLTMRTMTHQLRSELPYWLLSQYRHKTWSEDNILNFLLLFKRHKSLGSLKSFTKGVGMSMLSPWTLNLKKKTSETHYFIKVSDSDIRHRHCQCRIKKKEGNSLTCCWSFLNSFGFVFFGTNCNVSILTGVLDWAEPSWIHYTE